MDTTTKYGQSDTNRNESKSDTSFKNDMNDVKDSVSKAAQHASEKAGEMYNNAKDQTADIQKTVVEYVKANPVKSIGYAILTGFLTAIILRK